MRKQTLITCVAGCLYYSGLVKLVRWWKQHRSPCVIILNYHRASGGDLRRHLLYLRRHYRILHLEQALEELSSGQQRAHGDARTPLVLTFDDGYRDNYTHAFRLACELQVPITIFLIPGYVESGELFWWLAGDHIVQHATVDKVTIEGHSYRLEQPQEKKALANTIYMRALNAVSVVEREMLLTMISRAAGVPTGAATPWESVLTWENIREMEESGWVSFGAHTMHHPVLAYLQNPVEVQSEISTCRTIMEQHLGHRVSTFAYPLGKPEHVGKYAPQVVQEAGYKWAVTTLQGINTADDDPYQLRRLPANVMHHWLVMAAEITGVWQACITFYQMLKHRR